MRLSQVSLLPARVVHCKAKAKLLSGLTFPPFLSLPLRAAVVARQPHRAREVTWGEKSIRVLISSSVLFRSFSLFSLCLVFIISSFLPVTLVTPLPHPVS